MEKVDKYSAVTGSGERAATALASSHDLLAAPDVRLRAPNKNPIVALEATIAYTERF
jgi:hypothetical protein